MAQDKGEPAAKQGGDPYRPLPEAYGLAEALDSVRLDEIAPLADLASSYWRSISLAADRGDTLTLITHCKQIAAVTRQALLLASELTETSCQVEPK